MPQPIKYLDLELSSIGDELCIRDFAGWAMPIRFRVTGVVNHTAFCLGNGQIIEANPGGVKINPIGKYQKKRWSLLTPKIPLTAEEAKQMAVFAMAQKGKGYDYLGVLGITLNIPINEREKWYCSELSYGIRKAAKVIVVERVKKIVLPQDIYQSIYFKEKGNTLRI